MVDVKARSHFETRNAGEFWDYFQVPMIVVPCVFIKRGRLDDHVKWWGFERAVQLAHDNFYEAGKLLKLVFLPIFKKSAVTFGQNQRFKREPGGERSKRDEIVVFFNDP